MTATKLVDKNAIVIDFGCGVGNAIFPLMSSHPGCTAYAFDVSRRAVDFLKQRAKDESSHALVGVGVWDLINETSPAVVETRSHLDGDFNTQTLDGHEIEGDVGLLLFVLSAIPPEHTRTVLMHIYEHLAPGGVLFFRDYARYDHKEIRFASRKCAKLGDHFYVRQDGTLAVYFDKADLKRLVEDIGFEVSEMREVSRLFKNRKTGEELPRCWIQGVFRRPPV
eukprot:Blabericola_migrator_1__9111@NODE_486_length_8110_cov_81_450578_g376_i0_p3_GENE_NODE_486_length_8110_cov_81_450578_g376_i0NODE_486_length_8110_cov_81_450578_g376_i0_p3_ORF_typecomplete_len223_score60_80Methyltransf_23/PF13489_6/1_4e20Methyltransf_12/PF08242_12/6_7e11Methyltransf_31/PF13847_6/4_8e10Methyltransf_25/PF13649_6/9_3e09TehB/PF03848_14/1e07MTS/PF05175_14/1e06Methyltransf_20/PF12147_8/6_6e07CMAS/PF02353_20/2_3e06Methyltransf_11/PF08241_12/5_1e06Methyltransf_2/PF00891_18/5_3e06Met_10/PF02